MAVVRVVLDLVTSTEVMVEATETDGRRLGFSAHARTHRWSLVKPLFDYISDVGDVVESSRGLSDGQ